MGVERKHKLISHIKAAFADVIYPGDDNLVALRSEAIGEQASIAGKLKGKHWTEIPPDDYFWHHASFSMMSPEGFQFYLPAFLIACLNDPEEVDFTFQALIWALSPPPFGTGTEERFAEITHLLNAKQRKAIRLFFDYIRGEVEFRPYLPLNEDAEDYEPYLTEYWSGQEASSDRT